MYLAWHKIHLFYNCVREFVAFLYSMYQALQLLGNLCSMDQLTAGRFNTVGSVVPTGPWQYY